MRIRLISIFVDDQNKALRFYTGHPAASAYQAALRMDGIPITAFESMDIHSEVQRLKERGVVFTMEPTVAETETIAIFSDTCGNLLQVYQQKT